MIPLVKTLLIPKVELQYGPGYLRRAEYFWLRLTTANAQCLHLSELFLGSTP